MGQKYELRWKREFIKSIDFCIVDELSTIKEEKNKINKRLEEYIDLNNKLNNLIQNQEYEIQKKEDELQRIYNRKIWKIMKFFGK